MVPLLMSLENYRSGICFEICAALGGWIGMPYLVNYYCAALTILQYSFSILLASYASTITPGDETFA
ncbi:MAG TPA: hypothetical protein IGS37_10830 [Synechococcales cyanobacterium M55_K2018_004]|nr:hypothetical protein [Synechococcales cyanobacterium M55_K2018_004]